VDILGSLTYKSKVKIMGIEQIMQALQQNPQMLIQLVQMLIRAGICAPGPKMQGMGAGAPPGAPGGGPPRPAGMQPNPGGGPAGPQGGPGMGMARAGAMGAGRPGGLMR